MFDKIKTTINSLNEELPEGLKDFYFSLGGTPLFLFVIQVATGVLLLLHYVPSSEGAYYSVERITKEVSFGWWVRGLHKYGASAFIITVLIHVIRTFFTSAYRKPREFIWVAGGFLLLLSFGMGFTGYALVSDQLSYWATKVGTQIAESIPLIGTVIANFIRGGSEVGVQTIPRMFSLHAFIMPIMICLFAGIHIFLVRIHGVSIRSEKNYPLIPDHIYTEAIIVLVIVTTLSLLTVIFPPSLGEIAKPFLTPSHIKPEWYFYPVYLLLRIVPLYPALVLLSLFGFVFLFIPWITDYVERRVPFFEWIIKACGVVVVLYYCAGLIIISNG